MSHPIEVRDIQSLVFSGHGRLRQALALGLAVTDRTSARVSLRELVRQDVSFGISRDKRDHALQLLLSATGIAAIDGNAGRLAGLDVPFREGIVTPQRSRALGDTQKNDPASWAWRDTEVHALLLVYGESRAALAAGRDRLPRQLATGWNCIFELPVWLPRDDREPFGFRDGISSVRVDVGDGSGAGPGIDLVPPGEIVLGHHTAGGTVISPPPLGLNGTYVVVRQLEQDVEGFWAFWRSQAKTEREAVWLAAKAVGRWPNGMPLRNGPPGPEPACDDHEVLRPLSFDDDRLGRGCPFGAHIRRANPRDALVDDPRVSREIVAQHRLIRRGRVYGSPAPATWYPQSVARLGLESELAMPTERRGLLFMCLCSDIARQFEFIQQTWLNNPKFADLYDESDVISAGEGIPQDSRRFSIPGQPLRRRIHGMQRWVTLRAGGYFLMPGRSALEQWLAPDDGVERRSAV